MARGRGKGDGRTIRHARHDTPQIVADGRQTYNTRNACHPLLTPPKPIKPTWVLPVKIECGHAKEGPLEKHEPAKDAFDDPLPRMRCIDYYMHKTFLGVSIYIQTSLSRGHGRIAFKRTRV